MELKFDFENEYVLQYLEFIESRDYIDKNSPGENHHIFPKSIFGENSILIRLSYQDHFRAHWFLAKMYEESGQKRQYMQMAKALFSFVGIADYRKEVLIDCTEEEIIAIGVLVAEAKEHNRLSSIGELNAFYGKTHSPESIQSMIDTKSNKDLSWSPERTATYIAWCAARDPDTVRKWFYHDVLTLENRRFSRNDINLGNIPQNFVEGKYFSPEELLHRSLRAQEFTKLLSFDWVKKGSDSHFWKSKHIYNPMTNDNKRLYVGEELPDGFIYGLNFSDEGLAAIRAGSASRIGKPAPWVAEKINKNPEKIRKTAEKHRGMKRSDSNKENMSNARLKFFANGGEASNKDRTRVFNTLTRKTLYVADIDLESTKLIPEMFFGKIYFVTNDNGHKITITNDEPLPAGYKFAKNSLRKC